MSTYEEFMVILTAGILLVLFQACLKRLSARCASQFARRFCPDEGAPNAWLRHPKSGYWSDNKYSQNPSEYGRGRARYEEFMVKLQVFFCINRSLPYIRNSRPEPAKFEDDYS